MSPMEKTKDAARGRWRQILITLGVDEKYLKDEHGPCPICGGKDRFRFDDKEGAGTWFCNACGAGAGMQLLMAFKGWGFARAAAEIDRIVGNIPAERARAARPEASRREFMRQLCLESRPVAPGDPVHLYLTRRCGNVAHLLGDIRFHPNLKHSVEGGTHPAMLSFMGWNPASKLFLGIHRTYLAEDGQKALLDPVRMNYGDAGPVRLGPCAERLGIAEGIETAMCAAQRFGLPVWAGISANGVLAWEPPPEVRSVVLFGDNDQNFVGQAAAYEKARSLSAKGLAVEVFIPQTPGTDWADVWAYQA